MLSCFAPTGGYEWNYVRDRGRLPCLPLPVGFDSVPLGRPLVGYPSAPFADPFGNRYMTEMRLADFCMRSKGYDLAEVKK